MSVNSTLEPNPGAGIEYDPFSAEAAADPHAFYQRLRDEAPVYYVPEWDLFAVTRFQDIWDTLGDTSGTFLGTEGTRAAPTALQNHNAGPVPDPPTNPLLARAAAFGSPVYEQVRHAHGGGLKPKAVARLTEFVRDTARDRLAELLPRGRFDLAQEYGGFLSSSVTCHLLGIPAEDAPHALEAINAGTRTDRPDGDGGLDVKGLFESTMEFLLPAVARRRAAGADGEVPMVDSFLRYEFEGRLFNDEEIATQLICILVGGTETVPKVAAHGLWELAKHPDQLAAVRSDLATNVTIAREEMLRYCAPAQWFLRTVRRPTSIAGQEIRPGQRVILVLGAAARDEREYDNPDAFIWNRPIERSLAFGRGQHFCIGYHLARLELSVLVEEFLRAVPEFWIDEAQAERPPSSFQWGWNYVPVVVPAPTS